MLRVERYRALCVTMVYGKKHLKDKNIWGMVQVLHANDNLAMKITVFFKIQANNLPSIMPDKIRLFNVR